MSTARLATAHTFIGLAVAASMRMGLHSQALCDGLSELEKDIRRRVFWTIVKLDMYSGTVLGLPGMINLDYVDQLKPSGQTRDYANEDQGGFASISTRRMFAASAQYLEILLIMNKVTQKLYPKTDEEAHRVNGTKKIYISSSTISEIEEDFKAWREGLSDALGASSPNDRLSSIVYELEMVHNFGHILLYRPFLHYLAKTKSENPPEPRHLRCATACVKISRFTISRSDDMLRQGFFSPAAWQSVYTVFLSLVTLIFFLATQHGNKEYAAVKRDTECGIRILASTSCQDIGSRRCLDVLRVLTKRLSHIIDLDIDETCTGVKPLCRSHNRSPPRGRSGTQKPVQAAEEPRSHMPSQAGRASRRDTSPHSTNPQQFAYRPQAGPRQMASLNPHIGKLPYYSSPGMQYPAQMSMWEQSMGVPSTAHPSYMGRHAFQYGTPPPRSESVDSLGHSEMEVPYTEGFAWPFEMSTETAGAVTPGGGRGSHPPSTTHPLTQEDIAAFMRINPGEEPFL